MARNNPENARIKRLYFGYLKEARRYSEASVDCAAKSIIRFEEQTGFRSFKKFHREQAVAFKRELDEELGARTGKPLSRATVHATLSSLRQFFMWLAGQPGFRRKISYSDADYFNLSDKDTAIAKARREQPVPTIEQVRRVLTLMPGVSDVERRNKAIIAFATLTGARDGALASFKLRNLAIADGVIHQDARSVKTKFSKTFSTAFFPVGDDFEKIARDWVDHLRDGLGWSEDDPLFPATKIVLGSNGGFEAAGLERRHWASADSIRAVFKEAFASAGLPYFRPHSFRHMLVRLGEKVCRSPEEFKAWSQNLGHEQVLTTFNSYGVISFGRQTDLIRALGEEDSGADAGLDEIERLLEEVRRIKRKAG
jgi:integrase